MRFRNTIIVLVLAAIVGGYAWFIVNATVKGKGAMPAISVGKTTPIGFSAYIKTSDKPAVMLTSSAFPSGMKKKSDDLRDRELMTFKVDEAHKITLERSDDTTVEI